MFSICFRLWHKWQKKAIEKREREGGGRAWFVMVWKLRTSNEFLLTWMFLEGSPKGARIKPWRSNRLNWSVRTPSPEKSKLIFKIHIVKCKQNKIISRMILRINQRWKEHMTCVRIFIQTYNISLPFFDPLQLHTKAIGHWDRYIYNLFHLNWPRPLIVHYTKPNIYLRAPKISFLGGIDCETNLGQINCRCVSKRPLFAESGHWPLILKAATG